MPSATAGESSAWWRRRRLLWVPRACWCKPSAIHGVSTRRRAIRGRYGAPFLYATNGEEIWFHDARNALNRSRRVAEFHTPTALGELLGRDTDAELAKLATFGQNVRLRPYQVEANTTIEQAFRERKRTALLTMATGTGKTLTMVNGVYRLMKSGVARD